MFGRGWGEEREIEIRRVMSENMHYIFLNFAFAKAGFGLKRGSVIFARRYELRKCVWFLPKGICKKFYRRRLLRRPRCTLLSFFQVSCW